MYVTHLSPSDLYHLPQPHQVSYPSSTRHEPRADLKRLPFFPKIAKSKHSAPFSDVYLQSQSLPFTHSFASQPPHTARRLPQLLSFAGFPAPSDHPHPSISTTQSCSSATSVIRGQQGLRCAFLLPCPSSPHCLRVGSTACIALVNPLAASLAQADTRIREWGYWSCS